MGRWRFLITPQAEEDLAKLDRPVQRRIVDRIEWFVEHFEQVSPLPLGGNWKGFFKLRAGDWRIIYEAEPESQRVIVHGIGRRVPTPPPSGESGENGFPFTLLCLAMLKILLSWRSRLLQQALAI